MLTLNTFGPAFALPDASSFCMKAMWLLQMSGVEWQNNPGSDSRKAPMQKLPVLVDGDKIIADSDAIREYLQLKTGLDFDQSLTKPEKVTARALCRMAEEHLYFCLVFDRWKVDANWAHVKQRFFSDLPLPLRKIVPAMVRRSVLGNLSGQGLGRCSYAQMLVRAESDLSAIESLIEENGPFLFGQTPVSADVSVGSVLVSLAVSPEETGLSARVTGSDVLMNYIGVIAQEFYPTTA